jgi:4-amino-4-deoxy-L-arabinose transferase-like glycosyltransferase
MSTGPGRAVQDAEVNNVRHLLAILGVAFLARLLWAALLPVIPVSDCFAYHTFAFNLVHHGVYGWNAQEPSAIWPPGTSVAYALVYAVFGAGPWQIKCFNIAVGILIVLLTIELGTRWFNRKVGIIAGLLVGSWPVFIEYTTIIGSEPLFTAALLAILLLFDRILSDEKHFKWLAAGLGVLIGLTSLLRPPALLFPGLFAFVFLIQKRQIISSLKLLAIVGAFSLLVIAPWSARNYTLFGQFVAISTSGGMNLWMGNNPATTGEYQLPPALDGVNEAQRDRILGNEATSYIEQAPVAFVMRSAVKAVRLYERETIGVWWNAQGIYGAFGSLGSLAIKVASQAFWAGALALFVMGCYFLFRQQGLASFASHPGIATLVYFTLIYAIIVIQDRYHIPTDPIMAIFGAYAICRLAPVASSHFGQFGPILSPLEAVSSHPSAPVDRALITQMHAPTLS